MDMFGLKFLWFGGGRCGVKVVGCGRREGIVLGNEFVSVAVLLIILSHLPVFSTSSLINFLIFEPFIF